MKTLLVLAAAAAGGAATLSPCTLGSLFGGCDGAGVSSAGCDVAPAAVPVRGDYVEARDLAVFAGACHRGSEVDAQGRAAVLAWRFEAGAAFGVDVAGLALVAAVESERNLLDGAPRRAVAWVDARASAAQRSALRAWLVGSHGDALGRLVAFEPAEIAFERDGDAFSVAVGDALELAGTARADRACCSMEEQRWYEPLAAAPGAVVGVAERCRFAGAADLAPWTYEDENNAFVTTFGPARDDCCTPDGRAALLGASPRESETQVSAELTAEQRGLLESIGYCVHGDDDCSPPRATVVSRPGSVVVGL